MKIERIEEFRAEVQDHLSAIRALYAARLAYIRLFEPSDSPYPDWMYWNPKAMGYEIGLRPIVYEKDIHEAEERLKNSPSVISKLEAGK